MGWRYTVQNFDQRSMQHTLNIFFSHQMTAETTRHILAKRDLKGNLIQKWTMESCTTSFSNSSKKETPSKLSYIGPQEKRKRGRPRATRGRTVESKMKNWGETWNSIKKLSAYRERWRSFTAAKGPSKHNGQ